MKFTSRLGLVLSLVTHFAWGASLADAEQATRSLIEGVSEMRSASYSLCNGRLTLDSSTPIPTSNVTAATTVYFTPYEGNRISLYSGTVWQLVTFTTKSVSVPATTTTPFDVFGYNNSGSLTLETVNWTNDTTRATAITTQNGIYVKSGDATRRYLGTGRTTGVSGQTEDSTSKRFLWNLCNRFPRKLLAQSNTNSWTYTSASWRAAGNVTTTGVTRVEFLLGQQVEPVSLEALVPTASNSAGVSVGVGIGLGSTKVNSADIFGGIASTLLQAPVRARYIGYPGVGYQFAQWLEYSGAVSTTSWFGFTSDLRIGGMLGQIYQ